MIIRTNDKTVNIKSIIHDTIRRNGKTYPALRFEFNNEATRESINTLLAGSFEILDDEGNILGIHEGYNTLKNISVTIGKITTDEQRIEELEATIANAEQEKVALSESLATAQAEKAELQNAIDVMVGGNAE